jgi:hypothetical protein
LELTWRCYNGPTYELTIVASDMIREPYTLPMFYTVPNDYIILRHIYNCVYKFLQAISKYRKYVVNRGQVRDEFLWRARFCGGPTKTDIKGIYLKFSILRWKVPCTVVQNYRLLTTCSF